MLGNGTYQQWELMCTWCLIWSVCAFQNWACIHVSRCALTVGPRSMCSGFVLAAPLRAHINIIIVNTIIIFVGSLRIVVCVSSCAYRRADLGAGPCDVYLTVFCPTLRSLSVRIYSARVSASPPPAAILRWVSILTDVSSAGVLLNGSC